MSDSHAPKRPTAPKNPKTAAPAAPAAHEGTGDMLDGRTGFARISWPKAVAILLLTVVTAATGVAITFSPARSGFADKPARGPGDIALYRAEIDEMATGRGYYEVAAEQLGSRGYPTRSVFNWRTPLPMWLIAQLPSPVFGKVLLALLAAAVVVLALGAVSREGHLPRATFAGLLLTGALLPCVLGDIYTMPSVWAGVLIALSLCCYGVGRTGLAVGFGIAAAFCRDLAVPYAVICFGIALWNQRRGEIVAWSAGLSAYVVFFAVHMLHVAQAMPMRPVAHEGSWIALGGAPFVISTAQVNAYLLLLPQWITAVYLTLALLGAASWNSALGRRVGLTLSFYVVAFSVVGHDFNQYWGAVIAPLLCLAAAYAPAALADLWFAAQGFRSLRRPKTVPAR